VTLGLVALVGIVTIEAVNSVRIFQRAPVEPRFPQDYVSTGVWSTYALVRPPHPRSTDLAPVIDAAQSVIAGNTDLYAGYTPRGASFVYPPSAAVVFTPLAWFANMFGLSRATQAMDVLGRLCFLGILITCGVFLRRSIHGALGWSLLAIVILGFFPNRSALMCVQAQLIVNALLAAAILSYGYRHDATCGAAIAVAGLIKPHFMLLLLFLGVRRRMRGFRACALTYALGIAISVTVAGLSPWKVYLTEIVPTIANGYAWEGNQSFLGLARRWLGDEPVFYLSPAASGAKAFAAASLAILVILSAMPRERINASITDKPNRTLDVPRSLDLGVAILAVTMASPISWDHHYGWAVVLFCAAASQLCQTATSWLSLVALGVCYAALGSSWVPIAPGEPGVVSLCNSLPLFGAIGLLVIAWRATVTTRVATTSG